MVAVIPPGSAVVQSAMVPLLLKVQLVWAWHKLADPASATAVINEGIQRCIVSFFIIFYLGGLGVNCGNLNRYYEEKEVITIPASERVD